MFIDDRWITLHGCDQNPAGFESVECNLECWQTSTDWEEELAPKYVVKCFLFTEISCITLPEDPPIIDAKYDRPASCFFYKIGCNFNAYRCYIRISA